MRLASRHDDVMGEAIEYLLPRLAHGINFPGN